MTSPTSASTNRPAGNAGRPSHPIASRRRGFSLVELLVVLGIFVLLLGILLPSLNKARTQAVRARMLSDLQAIGVALDAFKADHGDIPRVAAGAANANYHGYDGAIALCQSLIAPAGDDNKDGVPYTETAPGFRVRNGGKVYGPYLSIDQFKIGPHPGQTPANDRREFVMFDRYEKPILYFPASPSKPNVRLTTGNPMYVAEDDHARWDSRDNLALGGGNAANALLALRFMLGDTSTVPAGIGRLDPNETEVNGQHLLWSAGPDGNYGPTAYNERAVRECDDILNPPGANR